MISDFLSVVIVGLMVILVLYPASQLARQTWAARRRRLRPGTKADMSPN